MRPLLASFLVLVVASAARAQEKAAPVTSRDWTRFPAVQEVDTTSDVFALGDVHGDDERMLQLLGAAGIVKRASKPGEVAWAAGTSVLVITGDMIDKGPHSLAVLRDVEKLEASAAQAKGRVVALLGNHEVEFLGSHGKKSEGFKKELDDAKIPVASVVSGESELGAWLRTRPLAARVDDWFFCHAGKTDFRTVEQLEGTLRHALETDGYGAEELLRADSLVEARLKPNPWWELPGEQPEATLDRLVGALHCKHLVMGHQPGKVRFADGSSRQKGELYQKYGRIFLIDTGMSRGVGDSEGALLKIHKAGETTEASVVKPDGSSSPLWRGE